MRSWTKPFGLAVSAAAMIFACVAVAAGTGSAQTPISAAASSNSAAGDHVSAEPRVKPAIANDNAADEAVLTPIVPCRAADTRHGGGRLVNGATRSFLIEGSGNFTSQGGPAAGCAIPNNATALAVVITAVNPSALGFFKAFPFGTPAPNSSVLDYSAVTTSSGAAVAITPNVARGLSVFNFGGPTDLTLDITGYYQPQITADIVASGTVLGKSSRVLSVSHVANSGFYTVTIDRPVEGPCSAQATVANIGNYVSAITEGDSTVVVRTWFLLNGNVTANDTEFNLSVIC